MTTSLAMVDFSTYGRRPVDVRPSADETQKTQCRESERLRLSNRMIGLAVTTLSALVPHAGWTATVDDCSILGRSITRLNNAVSAPTSALPAPLPFLDSYFEMLSCKALEDGWDDVSSKSISDEVIDVALEFLALLPSDILAPEASPAGDGTVDWYWRNGACIAIVTFYPGRLVAYSATTDSGNVNDSFKLSGSIPSDLVESLRQL